MPVNLVNLTKCFLMYSFIPQVYNLVAMKEYFKKNPVLFISGILAIVSCFFVRPDREYISYINIRVLAILFIMMLIVSELSSIGTFDILTNKLLSKIHSSRPVSLVLVWLSFFMGMILTNDVTLVTLVPFAITLMSHIGDRKSLTYTLILMTVATNLGSMQTPIGNPQNIYLYTNYNMEIVPFTKLLLPYSAASLVLVTIAVFLLCRDSKIVREKNDNTRKIPILKLVLCIALFGVSFLVVLRVIHFIVILAVVTMTMLVIDRKAFKGVDYTLLITFVFFFIFVGNMGRIDYLNGLISGIVSRSPVLTSILLSQVISNVPASLLLSAFTSNGEALVIGTNLGGLGTLIASMASLITYKFHASLPKDNEKGVNYVLAFSIINVIFLALLSGLYLLIR